MALVFIFISVMKANNIAPSRSYVYTISYFCDLKRRSHETHLQLAKYLLLDGRIH
jgi:hypothetical protein